MNIPPQPESADPSVPTELKLFGIGTTGLNILGQLVGAGFPAASAIASHSEMRSLTSSAAAEKVQMDSEVLRRLTAQDEVSSLASNDPFIRIKELCANTKVVCILAGLGGSLGTTVSPVVARMAKEAGALVLAFVTLPFDCEGNLRTQAAEQGLEKLKSVADLVFCMPNQKIVALVQEGTTLQDTFRAANQVAAACVRGASRALQSNIAMGLPFPDLCKFIRGLSTGCSFAVASASGTNRANEVVERLLAHPLLGGSAGLERAEGLAVWMVGGVDMGITEVNRVMELIQKQFQHVPAMMGAGLSAQPTEDLLVGLLIAQREDPFEEEICETERAATRKGSIEPNMQFLTGTDNPRPQSRFVPPPPTMTPELLEQMRGRQPSARRIRKASAKLHQTQLPLEIVSKGRFDKSEPTIHKGEDLDVPTYIRRGVALN